MAYYTRESSRQPLLFLSPNTEALTLPNSQISNNSSSNGTSVNVYVSNLPIWVTDEWLRHEFGWFGPITSAKVMAKPGKDKAFGFVQYTDPIMAQEAVTGMNGRVVGDGRLTVKIADRDKDKGIAPVPSNNVYVSNLPQNLTSEDVRALFTFCGSVSSLVVLTNPHTNQSRGVALVRFYSVEDASKAITMLSGVVLPGHDRPLEVKYAENDKDRNARKANKGKNNDEQNTDSDTVLSNISRTSLPSSPTSPFNDFIQETPEIRTYPNSILSNSLKSVVATNWNTPPQQDSESLTNADSDFNSEYDDQAACNVYVSNIPQWITGDWLHAEFSRFGPVTSSRVVMKPGKEKAFGFVQFTEPLMALEAVSAMNGISVGDSRLVVKLADRDKDKGIAPIPSNNVYVSNLPPSMSSEEVKTLFSGCGPIISLVVLTNPHTNISRGVALIRFYNVDDASQSINMFNRTVLPGHDRPLEVKFAENDTDRHNRKGVRTSNARSNNKNQKTSGSNTGSTQGSNSPTSDLSNNNLDCKPAFPSSEQYDLPSNIKQSPEDPTSLNGVNLKLVWGHDASHLFAPFASTSSSSWSGATDAG